jgi:hypothetical protein
VYRPLTAEHRGLNAFNWHILVLSVKSVINGVNANQF